MRVLASCRDPKFHSRLQMTPSLFELVDSLELARSILFKLFARLFLNHDKGSPTVFGSSSSTSSQLLGGLGPKGALQWRGESLS